MLAIIGASGKLGGATLNALLSHELLAPTQIVACTSAPPDSDKWRQLAAKGVHVRHASFDDGASLERALAGCDQLFLVSSPRVELDFDDAPDGRGRERQHRAAIDAARAARVAHVYYSSLAFASPSRAGVMRAHIRTERYLAELPPDALRYTVLREGIYSESWPLYLGYFDPAHDDRTSIPLAGDGRICWTAIDDLGLASALVLVAPSEQYAGKTFYLSTLPAMALDLHDVARLVGLAKGRSITVEKVAREAHDRYYIEERGQPEPAVEWWSSTYLALSDRECLVEDTTLTTLLASRGRKPVPMEETVADMLK